MVITDYKIVGLTNPDRNLRVGEQSLHISLCDFSCDIWLGELLSHLDIDPTMPRIRKISFTDQR
ncbi:unnamed protein product [Penicillium nalgiovense]|nr:unnamed protein product [Penicillium nalgiovense]